MLAPNSARNKLMKQQKVIMFGVRIRLFVLPTEKRLKHLQC